MHPLVGVLEIGGASRPIGSYGVFVALGIFVAGAVAVRAAHRAKADVGLTISTIALVIGLGFASAWLTFSVVDFARTGHLDAIARGGGLVAFGAVPGVALALWVARRVFRLDVLKGLELALPGVAAGHAMGRIGCFLGGCCFGSPSRSPWSVVYTDPLAPASIPEGIARHPSPLYEAAGLLVLAFAFALVPQRAPGSGQRVAAYVAAYSVLRFAVETTRGDAVRGVFSGVSTAQATAVVALVLAAVAGRALAHRA